MAFIRGVFSTGKDQILRQAQTFTKTKISKQMLLRIFECWQEKLQPRTKLLRQFHLFSNFCALLLSSPNRKNKPAPSPPPIQSCLPGLKTNVYNCHAILNNYGWGGGGKSGIHLAEVSVFAGMTGKNRHFCDLSQQVLSRILGHSSSCLYASSETNST